MFKMKTKLFSVLLAALTALLATVMAFATLFHPTTTTAFAADGAWTLVTDASTLAVGDQVIIAAKDYDFALSTTQNSNNRGQAAITKNGNAMTFTTSVQELTLEAGQTTGTFAFNTGNGYLYAASSSSNYLRTETKLSDNSSWTIAVAADGTATVVAQGTNKRNTMQYNQSSSLFACYGSASQKAICLYKLVEDTSGGGDTGETPECKHENVTTIDGKAATCTETGLTEGKKCSSCGEVIVEQEKIDALGHNYVDDVCSVCGAKQLAGVLVTDASMLAVGDQVIIAANDKDYALSTTQNGNNRGQAAITKSDNTITFGNDVQMLTLEKGNIDGTFAFNTGDGYLYAASSSSNYLRTEATLSDNSSWKIEIAADGTATVVAQGTNTRNTMQYNQSSSLFSCYAFDNNQSAIVLYKSSSSNTDSSCEHVNTTTTTVDATCTENGSTTVTCDDCGETVSTTVISAGHKTSEVVTKEASCTEVGSKTISCSECDYTEILEIPKEAHNYVDGVCSVCGEEKVNASWIKVTEEPTDWSGKYIIVYEEGSVAFDGSLTELDEANNIVNVTIAENIIQIEDKYAFTIAQVDGGYTIQSASGYYIGQTTTANGLKFSNSTSYVHTIQLEEDLSISIAVAGTTLRYNYASNQNRFRYYASGQKAIALYKLVEDTSSEEPVQETKISGASLTIGSEISINYYVTIVEADNGKDVAVTFTMNGKTLESEKATEDDGRIKYSIKVAPQYMADEIFAVVTIDGEEKEPFVYSVKTYAQNKLNAEDSSDELKQLLIDMLYYGAAAQNYTGYNTENLATAGLSNEYTPSTSVPETTDFNLDKNEEISSYPAYFKGAGVHFNNVNKIYVALSTTENVTLKVDGVEVEVDGTTIYTDGILATQFGETYTFELYHDGVLMQTLTYSVNAYAFSMKDNAEMSELALALYRYGASASAYQAYQDSLQ